MTHEIEIAQDQATAQASCPCGWSGEVFAGDAREPMARADGLAHVALSR